MPERELRGRRFEVVDQGAHDGPAIVLSNSLASNLGMWDGQAAALRAAGWRVLRYDNRGHGGSGPPDGPVTIEDMADDAAALMDAVGLESAHFCGLSLGGMIGQCLAVRHPGRVLTLTLCDTAAHMGPPELWDGRIEAVREGGMAAVVDATLGRWFTDAGRARLGEAVAAVRDGILSTTQEGFCTACVAIRDMDQRESIRGIAVPTHVIVGAEDPSTPVAAAELIHARIPGSTLTVIPDAAHLANVEQPGAFDRALLGFLERHA